MHMLVKSGLNLGFVCAMEKSFFHVLSSSVPPFSQFYIQETSNMNITSLVQRFPVLFLLKSCSFDKKKFCVLIKKGWNYKV